MNSNQPNEETQKTRSERVLKAELLWSSVELGHLTLLVHQCAHQPGSFTELWCPDF